MASDPVSIKTVGSGLWTSLYKKVIELPAKVWRRARKRILSLRAQPYEEKLKRLNLLTLERWRLREDLIQVSRYLNKYKNVDHANFFGHMSNTNTRNNGLPN